MHIIEKCLYGFRVTLSGVIEETEAGEVCATLLALTSNRELPFGLFFDCRDLVPFTSTVVTTFEAGLATCSRAGCRMAIFAVNSPVVRGQMLQMYHNAPSSNQDLVIDASKEPDYEKKAVSLLTEAVESLPQPSGRPQA